MTAPSSSLLKVIRSTICQLLSELQILMKGGVNCFSHLPMSLSKFLDILLPVVLHFGGGVGDCHICIEVTLFCLHCRQFPLLCLLIIAHICISCKGLVTVDLPDNFLNILKLFLVVESELWNCHDGDWMG